MVFSIKEMNREVLVTNSRMPTFKESEKGVKEVFDRVIIRFEDERPYCFVERTLVYMNGNIEENLIS